jgi:hypothetical protein
MSCNALGLNSHFPRAILYGSTLLGGIGLPTQTQKTTKDRINYFLYNMHQPSPDLIHSAGGWNLLSVSVLFI